MWTTRLRLESLSPLSRRPIHTFPQRSPGYFIQGCSACTLALGTHRRLDEVFWGGPDLGGPAGPIRGPPGWGASWSGLNWLTGSRAEAGAHLLWFLHVPTDPGFFQGFQVGLA